MSKTIKLHRKEISHEGMRQFVYDKDQFSEALFKRYPVQHPNLDVIPMNTFAELYGGKMYSECYVNSIAVSPQGKSLFEIRLQNAETGKEFSLTYHFEVEKTL